MLRAMLVIVSLSPGSSLAADAEMKPFAGIWVVADALLAGRDHKDDFAAMKLTITGNVYTIDFGLKSDAGLITLHTDHSPMWIDLTTKKDGPFLGRTLPGIYEFRGGKLVICCNSEKNARPKTFDAQEKTPLMLITFERAKK